MLLLSLSICFVFCGQVAVSSAVKVGGFAQVLNAVEKVFIDTSGHSRNIWKGGVVVREDTGDGLCHVAIKELRVTFTEIVTYGVDFSRLIPSGFECPSAAVVSHSCQQTDIACSSDSLFYNGFVVINGPIVRYVATGSLCLAVLHAYHFIIPLGFSFPGSVTATSFAV